MQAEAKNLKPFRRLLKRVEYRLYQKCVTGRDYQTRAWHISAWAPWILFEFRNAPSNRQDFRSLDIYTVNRYKRAQKRSFSEKHFEGDNSPIDWVERSLEVFIAEDVFLTNGRTGTQMKLKPSKLIREWWAAAEELEGQYNPYAINANASLVSLIKDHKRLKLVVRELCKITGCEIQI